MAPRYNGEPEYDEYGEHPRYHEGYGYDYGNDDEDIFAENEDEEEEDNLEYYTVFNRNDYNGDINSGGGFVMQNCTIQGDQIIQGLTREQYLELQASIPKEKSTAFRDVMLVGTGSAITIAGGAATLAGVKWAGAGKSGNVDAKKSTTNAGLNAADAAAIAKELKKIGMEVKPNEQLVGKVAKNKPSTQK